jgi:hypothetical protein
MKTEDVEKLCAVAFKKSPLDHLVDYWQTYEDRRRQERAERKFFLARPDLGWHIARNLTFAGKNPATLKKPECRWLRKAMVYIASLEKVRDADPDLEAVAQAHKLDENQDHRAVVRAALLAGDATAESVAAALGLPQPVVEAYDALFFNVLDHKADKEYLQNAERVALTRRGWQYFRPNNFDRQHQALFQTARQGSLQDVLNLIGYGKAGDRTPEAAAGTLMQDILNTAIEWMTANRASCSTPPPLVMQAIDYAKKTTAQTKNESEDYPQSAGVFSAMAYEAIDQDVQAYKADIAAKVGISDPRTLRAAGYTRIVAPLKWTSKKIEGVNMSESYSLAVVKTA